MAAERILSYIVSISSLWHERLFLSESSSLLPPHAQPCNFHHCDNLQSSQLHFIRQLIISLQASLNYFSFLRLGNWWQIRHHHHHASDSPGACSLAVRVIGGCSPSGRSRTGFWTSANLARLGQLKRSSLVLLLDWLQSKLVLLTDSVLFFFFFFWQLFFSMMMIIR